MPQPPKRLYAIPAIAFAGFVLALLLTQHYYEVRNGTAGLSNLCNINEKWNCNAVASSSAAEMIAGLPLSSFAAAWFATVGIIGLFAFNRFWRRETLRWLFALSAFGMLMSGGYLFVMITQIKALCVYCIGVDVAVTAIFGLTLSLKPEGFKEHKLDLKQGRTFATIGALSLIVIVLGLRSFDSAKISDDEVLVRVKQILATPPVAVRIGPEFAMLGAEPAPITIVEFSDFQCPYCKVGANILRNVQAAFPKDVRIVFRNFPLDVACNSEMKRPLHQAACEAATVAWCSHQQGKFEPVYESFFEKQEQLAPGKPTAFARDAGVNADTLSACTKSDAAMLAIRGDVEEAVRLNVQSTPTFFINGYRVDGAYPAPIWRALIRELLARQRNPKPMGYAALSSELR